MSIDLSDTRISHAFNLKNYPDALNLTDSDYWNKIFSYFHTQPNWKLPQVISISYYNDEENIPLPYAKYICNLIGILGFRGITVMGCTGDLGLGSPCRSKTGELQFNAVFPSTCPYFTAVGASTHVPEVGFLLVVEGSVIISRHPVSSRKQSRITSMCRLKKMAGNCTANMPISVAEGFQILR